MGPSGASKDCTMRQYVFRRQWEPPPPPEEASSHTKKQRRTMAAVRPGKLPFLFIKSSSYSTLSSAACVRIPYGCPFLTDTFIALFCQKTFSDCDLHGF